jgi:hypothetical protein
VVVPRVMVRGRGSSVPLQSEIAALDEKRRFESHV